MAPANPDLPGSTTAALFILCVKLVATVYILGKCQVGYLKPIIKCQYHKEYQK